MKKSISFFLTSIASLLSAPSIYAQTVNLMDPDSPYANLYAHRPSDYVKTAILWLLGGSGIASFLYLLLGGFQWITSGGDKDAAEKSRKKIIYAMTGLAIVFSSYAILFVIRVLFNVDLLNFTIAGIGS